MLYGTEESNANTLAKLERAETCIKMAELNGCEFPNRNSGGNFCSNTRAYAAEVNLERAERERDEVVQAAAQHQSDLGGELIAAEAKLAAVPACKPEGFEEWLSKQTDWLAKAQVSGAVSRCAILAKAAWMAALSCKPAPLLVEEELERLEKLLSELSQPMFRKQRAFTETELHGSVRKLLSRLREVQSQGNTEKGGKK